MKHSMKVTVIALALALSAPLANAAVVYDESVDGDAATVGGGALVGATVPLSIGDNDILGSREVNDFDDYIFTLESGWNLSSILFTSLTDIDAGWQASLYTDTGTWLGGFDPGALFAGIPVAAFSAVLPLGEGTYRIDHWSGPGTAVDYQWRISVSVPEPATLALLGLGVAGLAASRRRKQ